MKRLFKAAIYAAVILTASGCAKNNTTGLNDSNKRYFEAWLEVNGINVKPSERGIYILEDVPGTGKAVEEDGFVYMEYTTTNLDGDILSFTNEDTAKQLGKYSKSAYYGPEIFTNFNGVTYAGVLDMLKGMKVGGSRKVIIPSWLLSFDEYETEEEYLATASGQVSTIYDITVKDFTDSIAKWEVDSIGRFFNNDKVMIAGIPAREMFSIDGRPMTSADSVRTGFYYKQLKAPVTDEVFHPDTTIYINYTGMRLDGQVFDTTYEDVAKDNNIYSPSRTYEPVQIKWPGEESKSEEDEDEETVEGEEYTEITMGSSNSSVIKGFALTLWQMKALEEGIGLFYSPLGYSYSGSGDDIPAYSPLIFKIEIVKKP